MEKLTHEEILQKIEYIRHSQLITDPFPEVTEMEHMPPAMFAWVTGQRKNTVSVSPHEAYMKGYDKAYEEIMNYFKS